MYSTDGVEPVAGPLDAAVDAVGTAVEHLIKLVDDGAHTDLGVSNWTPHEPLDLHPTTGAGSPRGPEPLGPEPPG